MRQIIKDTFFDFTAQREGFTPFLYADTLNLVTTGVGNLVDAGPNNNNAAGNMPSVERARLNNVVSAAAMDPAMRLPWRLKGPGWTSKNPVAGPLVSPSEIADAWTRVKRQNEVSPDFSQKGGFAYAGLTNLTLDMQSLKDLFSRTLISFDARLAKDFAGYETYPADAQLAMLSMAWAMGPGYASRFPAFRVAVQKRDFDAAAGVSYFKGGGGTPENRTGRNKDNALMFHNAAMVERTGASPDSLIFPGTSGSVGGSVIPSIDSGTVGKVVLGSAAASLGVWAGWKIWETIRK
jgi:hypothetical protein